MKRTRLHVLLVGVAMLAALFISCGKETLEQPSTTNTNSPVTSSPHKTEAAASLTPVYMNMESELPIVKDGEKVTISLTSTQSDAYPSSPEDIWLWEYMRQSMNIDLQVEHVLSSAADEQLSLMFASEELPDILIGFNLNADKIVRYGQVEKQLLNIAPYLTEEYAPNMLKMFAQYKDILPAITAPDGGIYTSFGYISDLNHQPRFFLKKAWLDKKNMTFPKTIDEFTDLLRAYKQDDPDSIPLGGAENGSDPRAFLLSAFGYIVDSSKVDASPALRNGEAVIPAADATYVEFLKLMNMYYSESLISEDFFTLDNIAVNGQMAEDLFVATAQVPFLVLPEPEGFQKYWGAIPLTSDYNDTPIVRRGNAVNIGGMVFSSKTKHPEVLVRIADYFFGNEGGVYKWGGPMAGSEDTLGMIGGLAFKEGSNTDYYHVDVEEGTYPSAFAYLVSKHAPWGGSETFGYRGDIDNPENQFIHMLQQMGGVEMVGKVYREDNGDDYWRMGMIENAYLYLKDGYPSITYFSEEDTNHINELKTVLGPHMQSETAKFITGVRSLDTFDQYISELKTMGLDDLLGYYTKGYQDYLSKME